MKTKIIGFFAIVIAIGASAFNSPKKVSNNTMYYWFLITDGNALGNAVPQSQASFIQESTAAPTESACGSGSNQCVSGFTSGQVNGSDQLINNNQVPAEQPSSQN